MKTEGKKYHNNKPTILFQKDDADTWIDFDDGEIDVGAYSYEIASTGTFRLDSAKTKQLYLVMKEYYEDYKDEEAMKIIHEAAEEIKKKGIMTKQEYQEKTYAGRDKVRVVIYNNGLRAEIGQPEWGTMRIPKKMIEDFFNQKHWVDIFYKNGERKRVFDVNIIEYFSEDEDIENE